MIDWLLVFRHALWIAGSAIALAAWSYARIEGFTASALRALRAGALLFCAGLALVLAFDLWKT